MNKLSHHFHLPGPTGDRYLVLQKVGRDIAAIFGRGTDGPAALQIPNGTALWHLEHASLEFHLRSRNDRTAPILSRAKARVSLEAFLPSLDSFFHEPSQSGGCAYSRAVPECLPIHSYDFCWNSIVLSARVSLGALHLGVTESPGRRQSPDIDSGEIRRAA